MEIFKKFYLQFFRTDHLIDPKPSLNHYFQGFLILVLWILVAIALIYGTMHSHPVYAAGSNTASLPGSDASGQLEAAGILLKTLDTGIFKWGARIFAGLCIMSSAWALKEQRFGIAIICVIGAIIFGTAPKWVQNIFTIGGDQGLFSQVEKTSRSIRDV